MSVAKRLGTLAVGGLIVLVLGAPAQGQIRRAPGLGGPVIPSFNPYAINPNPFIPGTNQTYRQFAYNTAVLGAAAASIPPWLYGYNPYPQAVNFGPSFPTITPAMAAGPGYGSSGFNPY